jgi:ATP-dependent protease Clp ATPase subunit
MFHKPEEQLETISQLDKIFTIFASSEGAIRPHFILTGPSGSGKSHTIEALCHAHNLNYFLVNAAQLTKEGTAGNSLSKALSALLMLPNIPTVCFVDEFDKLFISGNSNSDLAHEVTHGVQNEFLKVLEAPTTSVFGDYGKYIEARVDNVLFIFAGAFNGEEDMDLDRLRDFGIKTEFLGRVGLVYNLEKLTLNTLEKILNEHALLATYLELYPKAKKQKVVADVMKQVKASYDHNTLGVRILSTLIHQYFIQGGQIKSSTAKKSTFQKRLELQK